MRKFGAIAVTRRSLMKFPLGSDSVVSLRGRFFRDLSDQRGSFERAVGSYVLGLSWLVTQRLVCH